jgi:N-succinyldiaminopimelate aminotransferase
MNPYLGKLQPYPFEKLAALFRGAVPPAQLPHITLGIGEPKNPSPPFVLEALARHLERVAVYPTTKGSDHLREAIAAWAMRRFRLARLDPGTEILPVNGTREALFSFAQAVVDPSRDALVVSPNPFYQIYEGAALLAGATPHFVPCTRENGYLADYDAVPEAVWQRCQLLYVCSPGNPTGAVLSLQDYHKLIELADRYDFVIASDECYSEIYFDEAQPPPGLLEACAAMGRDDYARCVVFHSLSKRSNLPGLRSGFVAGDAKVLGEFLRYRTYHGCAMSLAVQEASVAAWQDETHVQANRAEYRARFRAVIDILQPVLPVTWPDAGFYLWVPTPVADDVFARGLYADQHVTVLPGSYLSRPMAGVDPGANRVRLALVAGQQECVEAAQRIRRYVENQR